MKANQQDKRKGYRSLLSEFVSLAQYVWKHALILLLFITLCVSATAGCFFRHRQTSATMLLTLNYEKAAFGLAPNGEKLDMYALHGVEVMSRALNLAGITDVNPEDLSDCVSLNIRGTPSFSVEDKTSYTITTSYSITFKQNELFQHTRISAHSMIALISRAFYEYFAEKYIDKGIEIKLTQPMNEELEYMEQWELINMHANQLRSYLVSRSVAAPSFISRSTGESFASLRQKMDNLISVYLSDCRAYLLENGIARDRQIYIDKLNYINENLNRNRNKRKASYEIRMQVTDEYDGKMISTVLIPTENSNHKFYMSKTETGIDYLAVDANYDAVSVSTFQKMIDTNTNLLLHMQSKSFNTRETVEKATGLLQTASDNLEEILRVTQLIVKEYNQSEANDYLLWHISDSGSLDMIGGKTFLALCFVYVALALLAAYSFMHRGNADEKL